MAFDRRELHIIRELRGLTESEVLSFVAACTPVEVGADDVLIEGGEVDRSMLFLLEGELEAYIGRPPLITTLRRVGRGEHLGELAALGLVPQRTASVRALTDASLLVIDDAGMAHLRGMSHRIVDRIESEVLLSLASQLRETDRRIAHLAVGHITPPEPDDLWHRLLRPLTHTRPLGWPPAAVDVLQQSPHFMGLTRSVQLRLGRELEPVGFRPGDVVVEEGSSRGDAWILAAGTVSVWRTTVGERHEQLATLQPGALFGHLAAVDGDIRTATCVAESPAWLYRVPRELCATLVNNATLEGRALRRCLIDATVQQLQQANERLDEENRQAETRMRPDLYTAEDLDRLRADRQA